MSEAERERLGLMLLAEAASYASKNNVTLAEGYAQVCKERPNLYDAYNSLVLGQGGASTAELRDRLRQKDRAARALMSEVNARAKENKCSIATALNEVARSQPELWRNYSEAITGYVSENPNESEE
jgi:hypothetical protein